MKRFASQYLYVSGKLYHHYVIEVDEDGIHLFLLDKEIASTVFFNGLLLVVNSELDSTVIQKQLMDALDVECDLLAIFSKLGFDKMKANPNHFQLFLFENIDLKTYQWLSESILKPLTN